MGFGVIIHLEDRNAKVVLQTSTSNQQVVLFLLCVRDQLTSATMFTRPFRHRHNFLIMILISELFGVTPFNNESKDNLTLRTEQFMLGIYNMSHNIINRMPFCVLHIHFLSKIIFHLLPDSFNHTRVRPLSECRFINTFVLY
ncbi:hypothetical protein AKO1_013634 [Acrasis kona]|uniref:Uncharacterized protein n=1 Tax=Acrasis kona TaxID=1008807 RepID=A0AAW2YV77_9EUKA